MKQRRSMTPLERLVGRCRPSYPTGLERILASFIAEDGAIVEIKRPSDPRLRAALFGAVHQDLAYKEINNMYRLTPEGIRRAREARHYVDVAENDLRSWKEDARFEVKRLTYENMPDISVAI